MRGDCVANTKAKYPPDASSGYNYVTSHTWKSISVTIISQHLKLGGLKQSFHKKETKCDHTFTTVPL